MVSLKKEQSGLALSRAEERAIRRAMHAAGWNKCDAATLLEVSRSTLYRKLESFDWSPVTRCPVGVLGFGRPHRTEIQAVYDKRVRVDVDGRGWGVLDDTGRHYWVVDGPRVEELCPRIWTWAHSDLVLAYCSALAGEALVVCPGRNSVNLNWVSTEGYQDHVDSNPYTMVVYLSEVREGGELVVAGVGSFSPTNDTAVFFAGRYLAHKVEPCSDERLAMVISFDSCLNPAGRPEGLDDHMYGTS